MGPDGIAFMLDVGVTGICLFAASILRKSKIQYVQLVLILFFVTAIALIPYIGYVMSLAVFVYLLVRYTELDVADGIWVVIISKSMAMMLLICAGVQWGSGPMHFLVFPSHVLSNFILG